jgi:hypothetical protein
LLPDDTNAVYAGGFLFFVREPFKQHVPLPSAWRSALVDRAELVAQPFDAATATLSGDAVTMATDIRYFASSRYDVAAFSVSPHGVLAYRRADNRPATRLFWYDRAGHRLSDFGEDTFYPHPEISPDGTKVAFQRIDVSKGTSNIWIADLIRGTKARVTFSDAIDSLPVWSPDGKQLAFASDRSGPSDLYVKDVSGSSPVRRLAQSTFTIFPTSWSPDGDHILYQHHKGTKSDLETLSIGPPATSTLFAGGGADDASAEFSPDGRWVAHAFAPPSRIPHLLVEDFPRHAGRWQVAPTGWEPRWRGDERELYYLTIDQDGVANVMAVGVDAQGDRFDMTAPRRLFSVPVWTGPPTPRNRYAVTRDGSRFLMDTLLEAPGHQPITVVTDWRSLAKHR